MIYIHFRDKAWSKKMSLSGDCKLEKLHFDSVNLTRSIVYFTLALYNCLLKSRICSFFKFMKFESYFLFLAKIQWKECTNLRDRTFPVNANDCFKIKNFNGPLSICTRFLLFLNCPNFGKTN